VSDPAVAAFAAEHPDLPVRERWLDAGGLRLHLVEAGPIDGPPVVLFHGFPEFWWGWRRQLPALAAAGYRAVAPDLPGYNLSDKPRRLGAYRLDRLAALLPAIADDLGVERVPLVGHDWGGALAWWTALCHPERIARLAILNAPHPSVLRRALRSSPAQRKRNVYMLYFQLPWLPERKLAAGGHRPLRSMLRRTSRPGTFTESELERYAEAAGRPGALGGMLAWYRAGLRRPAPAPPHRVVEPETLILWGVDDIALGRELVEPSAARCRAAEVVWFERAGHWVQHEESVEVNRRLLAFLAPNR
jgi:pimeloyl-ACP methyl ester carboxylesterase